MPSRSPSTSKTERLLNLLIMLLVQRHYVSKNRIREILYADAPSADAFEKSFERDKEELRSLGVPIEVGQMNAYFDDEPGYRIRADQFALPEISLESDEASVVALATRVWEHARLAEATTDAVRKLTAAGLELDLDALEIAQPRLSADEPSFDVFWEATLARRPVTFDYRRPGYDQPLTRHLEPWGVVRFSGRWYVVGLDTDRGEERVFRLSRVVGKAKLSGPSGSFVVPPGTDVREAARRIEPVTPPEEVVVLVRPGAGAVLRRQASSIEPDVPGPDEQTPWDRLRLRRAQADELLALGPDLYVESPAGVRAEVVARLRATVGGRP
ncbi:MAG TPA: WYL domain-containing protein [Nocardioides sp.]|uniref:helix-turn-helix transcriptional regulator n=1 Tax=Nocardioides sp. TaxID=35761 RepID=UPI002F3E57AB